MSYQEFLDEILKIMKDIYPNCTVEIIDVTKLNNVSLKGLVIRANGTNVVPNIYMESFYKLYKWNWKMEEIVQKIKETYEQGLPTNKIDMSFFKKYELVKDKIVYRLINADQNADLLRSIPHIRFWDLAICFSYVFQSEELGEGMILIHNSHLEMWQVEKEELMKVAETNTPKLLPVQFCEMRHVLEQAGAEEEFDLDLLEPGCMYVLTNQKKLHGSAVILYPQVLSDIAAKIKRDFFILPSSLHEVLILPVKEDVEIKEQMSEMCNMVTNVNSTQLDPDEILSNNPFYYCYKERELRQLDPEVK